MAHHEEELARLDRNPRREGAFPAPFLLLSLLLILPVLALTRRHGFDGLYGQDPYAYYRYSVDVLRPSLLALEGLPPFFWPPGYPLLVVLLSVALGSAPLSAQIASLAAGALTPVFTALLAYELWSGVPHSLAVDGGQRLPALKIAVVAGLVTALTPQLWQSSAVIMPDVTGLACATLGMWALLRYGHGHSGAWLALAAAALAFAVLTRLPYATVALVAAAYALRVLAGKPRRVALPHAACSTLIALAVLSPILISGLRYLVLQEGQPYLGNLGTSDWNLRHALQNEFMTGNGLQQYPMANVLHYALVPAQRFLFSPFLAPFLLPGFWQLWKYRSLSRVLFLGAWSLAAYLLLVGYPIQNYRFTLTFLPPLAIILATGVVASMRRLRRLSPLLLVLLVCALLWLAHSGWSLTADLIAVKQADLDTVAWTERQVETGALLFTFGISLTFEQYTDFQVHDLYALTPAQMAGLLEDEPPAYLLLDVANIQSQWAQLSPGQNYRWLQSELPLHNLGRHRHYCLFRIGHGERDVSS